VTGYPSDIRGYKWRPQGIGRSERERFSGRAVPTLEKRDPSSLPSRSTSLRGLRLTDPLSGPAHVSACCILLLPFDESCLQRPSLRARLSP